MIVILSLCLSFNLNPNPIDPNLLKSSVSCILFSFMVIFFLVMFLFLQGEEIFLDMFEDEYRSMMVSCLTKHANVVFFATSLLLSVIT